jgi:hypothetical protein
MNCFSRIATLLVLWIVGQCLWAQALPQSIFDDFFHVLEGERSIVPF